MTREERVARAYGLRYVGGWKMQAIADELGVTIGTVSRWLDPDRTRAQAKANRAKRRPEDRQREYAKRKAAGRAPRRARLEVVCEVDRVLAQRERDDTELVAAWHRMLQDGSSIADVARLLGIGKPVLLLQVQRLREEGRDLPYRHQVAA